jgi:hypothetical protein
MNGTGNDTPATNAVAVNWRKSRHSGASGNCVELATPSPASSATPGSTDRDHPVRVETAVRDSRQPTGPVLRFPHTTMQLFLAGIKHGAFAGPPAPPARRVTEAPRQPRLLDGILDDVADQLGELTARGFQFAETRDARGNVVAVSGVRSHSGAIDIVQLFGEHDADAVRIPGSEPDIFFPRNILWRITGRPETVLTGILGLADPVSTEDSPAPAPRRRSWVSDLSYRGA